MREYIISVTFSILLCVGVSLVVPSPKYMGIMKIICGVFVVYTMLSPAEKLFMENIPHMDIRQFFDNGEFNETAEHFEDKYTKILSDSTQKSICNDVLRLWNDDIRAEFDDNSLYIYNADKENYKYIDEYIKEHYGLNAIFR